jgi:ribosomal protein S27AE
MSCANSDSRCHVLQSPDRAELQRLAEQDAPQGLVIRDYAHPTLHPLAGFGALEILRIEGAPRLAELAGTEALQALRELEIDSASEDAIEVGSLKPLERLTRAERIVLCGVRPRDLDLSPLTRMQQLRELELSDIGDTTVEDYARLAVALPNTSGRCLAPFFENDGIRECRKCRGRQVELNGVPRGAKNRLCPRCNSKLLAAHVARWEAVTGRRFEAPVAR